MKSLSSLLKFEFSVVCYLFDIILCGFIKVLNFYVIPLQSKIKVKLNIVFCEVLRLNLDRTGQVMTRLNYNLLRVLVFQCLILMGLGPDEVGL